MHSVRGVESRRNSIRSFNVNSAKNNLSNIFRHLFTFKKHNKNILLKTKKTKIKKRAMSVVEIKVAQAYTNGVPSKDGLLDLRMGTTDYGTLCQSCFSNRTECCGHFGHIELVRPVYHIGFLDKVLKVLRCVCFHCSRLLASRNSPHFKRIAGISDNKKRFKELYTFSYGIKRCGANGNVIILLIFFAYFFVKNYFGKII